MNNNKFLAFLTFCSTAAACHHYGVLIGSLAFASVTTPLWFVLGIYLVPAIIAGYIANQAYKELKHHQSLSRDLSKQKTQGLQLKLYLDNILYHCEQQLKAENLPPEYKAELKKIKQAINTSFTEIATKKPGIQKHTKSKGQFALITIKGFAIGFGLGHFICSSICALIQLTLIGTTTISALSPIGISLLIISTAIGIGFTLYNLYKFRHGDLLERECKYQKEITNELKACKITVQESIEAIKGLKTVDDNRILYGKNTILHYWNNISKVEQLGNDTVHHKKVKSEMDETADDLGLEQGLDSLGIAGTHHTHHGHHGGMRHGMLSSRL